MPEVYMCHVEDVHCIKFLPHWSSHQQTKTGSAALDNLAKQQDLIYVHNMQNNTCIDVI